MSQHYEAPSSLPYAVPLYAASLIRKTSESLLRFKAAIKYHLFPDRSSANYIFASRHLPLLAENPMQIISELNFILVHFADTDLIFNTHAELTVNTLVVEIIDILSWLSTQLAILSSPIINQTEQSMRNLLSSNPPCSENPVDTLRDCMTILIMLDVLNHDFIRI